MLCTRGRTGGVRSLCRRSDRMSVDVIVELAAFSDLSAGVRRVFDLRAVSLLCPVWTDWRIDATAVSKSLGGPRRRLEPSRSPIFWCSLSSCLLVKLSSC
jgi:hypothetical protein